MTAAAEVRRALLADLDDLTDDLAGIIERVAAEDVPHLTALAELVEARAAAVRASNRLDGGLAALG